MLRPFVRPCAPRPFRPPRQPVLETDPLIVMSEQMRDRARNCFVPGSVFGVTLEGEKSVRPKQSEPVRRNKTRLPTAAGGLSIALARGWEHGLFPSDPPRGVSRNAHKF